MPDSHTQEMVAAECAGSHMKIFESTRSMESVALKSIQNRFQDLDNSVKSLHRDLDEDSHRTAVCSQMDVDDIPGKH